MRDSEQAPLSGIEKISAASELRAILEDDPRVREVQPLDLNPRFTYAHRFFPSDVDDHSVLLTGADACEVLQLSDPLIFRIEVPQKNQPVHHGVHDIPAETYWVAWDGVTVYVTWWQPEDFVPMSGGHIVREILDEACRRHGDSLLVQACGPGCDNLFVHTTLHVGRLAESSPNDFVCQNRPDRSLEVEVLVPGGSEPEVLEWIHLGLNGASSEFAVMKNIGRRLLDIEDAARGSLSHLVSDYYAHAAAGTVVWWKRGAAWWRFRGWRREANQLLASLWASLTNIEMLSRQWGESQRSFVSDVAEANKQLIWLTDYARDAEAIESLDTSRMEDTVQQIATRLDNRAVVTSTVAGALGALAGGGAGAIAALIAH